MFLDGSIDSFPQHTMQVQPLAAPRLLASKTAQNGQEKGSTNGFADATTTKIGSGLVSYPHLH